MIILRFHEEHNTSNVQVSIISHLERINKSYPIAFLHIGKSGGTSFDELMNANKKKINFEYIGNTFFDLSDMDKLSKVNLVTVLRNPIERSVSNFWYGKKLNWTYKASFRSQNLTQFLNDIPSLLSGRGFWNEGEAGCSWLSGTHIIGNWVGKNLTEAQIDINEKLSLNMTYICNLAADRLESIPWFGILEDYNKSIEMLQWQLNSRHTLRVSHSNKNKHDFISLKEREILESLMPKDLWLYTYAKLLFEARWTLYKTGIWTPPMRPKIPKPSCQSTRFSIHCTEGPLAPLRYFDPKMPSRYNHYFELFK